MIAFVLVLLQVSEAACTVSEICSSEELLMLSLSFHIGSAAHRGGVAALGTPVPRRIRSGLGMRGDCTWSHLNQNKRVFQSVCESRALIRKASFHADGAASCLRLALATAPYGTLTEMVETSAFNSHWVSQVPRPISLVLHLCTGPPRSTGVFRIRSRSLDPMRA